MRELEKIINDIGPKKSKWIIIVQSVLLLLLSVACIGLLVGILTKTNGRTAFSASRPPVKVQELDNMTFTPEDYQSGNYLPYLFNGSWWSSDQLKWNDLDGNIVLWNVTSEETYVLFSVELMNNVSESGVELISLSPDETMALLAYDIEYKFSNYYTAKYVAIDLETSEMTAPTADTEILEYCGWGPTGTSIVFVFENNIYYSDSVLNENSEMLTQDGVADTIFNGIAGDWTYSGAKSDTLTSNELLHFSPNGEKLAYVQLNDSLVPEFKYPSFGAASDDGYTFHKYPDERIIRYAKSGENIPSVRVFVTTLSNKEIKVVRPPKEVQDWKFKYYYNSMLWINDSLLSLTWYNREQNQTLLARCNETAVEWRCTTAFSYTQQGGWVIRLAPWFETDGDYFLTLLPSVQRDSRHYTQVARVGWDGVPQYLTQGLLVVTELLGWDQEEARVYFMATRENSPGARHLYVTDTSGTKKMRCITCELKSLSGEVCEYNKVELNEDNTLFVHTCLGEGVPEVLVRSMYDGEILHTLVDNSELKESLKSKILPEKLEKEFNLPGNFTGRAKILFPPDREPGKKYPLLIDIYGGPESQNVDKSWSLDWGAGMVGKHKYVYAFMDGRGSEGQSDEHKFSIYRNLGTVEIQDFIAMTKEILEDHDCIDQDRVGVWGWSHGGYNTLMMLEKDNSSLFSCGVSVAPVVDWYLYHADFTEQYMGLPLDNTEGYKNSAIKGIENLRSKKLMLHHGTADDNVHYQHTMLLVRALASNNIMFEQFTYPDEDHEIGGLNSFLYASMEDFWVRCFD